MTNSPARFLAAQESERIDRRLGSKHLDAFQRVQRSENPQQRFHGGAPSRLQISQCFFGESGLFSRGTLIQIFCDAEASQLLSEAPLKFPNGLKWNNSHIGIMLPFIVFLQL
jgi:hypothetical protein